MSLNSRLAPGPQLLRRMAQSAMDQFLRAPFAATTSAVVSGLLCAGLAALPVKAQTVEADCQLLPRTLPPVGIEIPAEQAASWLARIAALEQRVAALRQQPAPQPEPDSPAHRAAPQTQWTDVAVLLKACRYAVEFRELTKPQDFAKVERLLGLAEQRLQLGKVSTHWNKGRGMQVRGFESAVDGSVQPLGIILPESLVQPEENRAANVQLPLYVWLHGRGDTATDLHFITERLEKTGEVAPADAITLHPFGRHCVGYKSAGSTDVMEAIDFACAHYPVDRQRIVLIGFSMGGAGVWHLAARYTDRFVAASPGAGFAETARYQNLTPEKFPPRYEQVLWNVYDVPGYVRNLFNIPVVAYSGELDKQIQAARVMEEAYAGEGQQLPHLIGPGMGHKYHPDVLAELLDQLAAAAQAGRAESPSQLHLQTRHWRVAQRGWIRIDGLQQPYTDTRVDAQRHDDGSWHLTTLNVSRLELDLQQAAAARVLVDGQPVSPSVREAGASAPLRLVREGGRWEVAGAWPAMRKSPGLSGPIEDAFFDPFLMVTPTGTSANPAFADWARCEQANAIYRWQTLMRGAPRVKRDVDVTEEDMQRYHLVCWGDPSSNQVLARLLRQGAGQLPLVWDQTVIRLGEKSWDAGSHAPVMILPNPAAPQRYLVINSGLTFRPAHDRTNSLQNPHLPDWSIIGLDEAPSTHQPGRIAAAGFFDDSWQFDPAHTYP
jgi:predicted esterase